METHSENFFDSITDEQVLTMMKSFGIVEYLDKPNYFVFPTICHNLDIEEASLKLYYYKESKTFVCYTECSCTYSIWNLVKKVCELREIPFGFGVFLERLGITGINDARFFSTQGQKYKTIAHKFKINKPIPLQKYDDKILNAFLDYAPVEWRQEGITVEALQKFNIKFCPEQMKIVIPHYDINDQLVGIRGRALDENEIELFGKYMPLKINNTMYAHPLSLNLYGLNYTKQNIGNKIILFEGEKSVLLYESYFDQNISAAVCGSNFHRNQLKILLEHFHLNEVILAFDKEYEDINTEEAQRYFKKLLNICKKYSNYVNISFIYDKYNLLKKKDSPIDQGKDVFLKLLNTRVKGWKINAI